MSKLSVDHILPIAKGGNDCNSKKSDTIDCKIKSIYLCERYKHKYLHNIDLSHILAKEVYEFKKFHIENATLNEIKNSIKIYAKKYNLGHNLDRIIQKIAIAYNKT